MTFLLLLYRWKIASVYHTQNEQNNRKCEKGKKKHNNRHMISMLAFLRQDASRYLLLKQLCVCVCVCLNIHIHIIYLMPSSRVLPLLSIAYRLQSAYWEKKRSNEFFKVWMNAVCKRTISSFYFILSMKCMRWRRRHRYIWNLKTLSIVPYFSSLDIFFLLKMKSNTVS